jgi:hypothetical protein
VGMQINTSLWKTVWSFLKKLKLELPYDPTIPLLGIYLKECESGYNGDTCTPVFIAAQFTTAKLWKQPRYSTMTNGLRKCMYVQWNIFHL